MIDNISYIHIGWWMINELKLKWNDLFVYAIIYSFTNGTENHAFNGSLSYLAEWVNGTKRGVQNNLNNLIEKWYVEKEEKLVNWYKFIKYRTKFHGIENFSMGIEKSSMGIEKSSTNIQVYIQEDKKEINKEKNSNSLNSLKTDEENVGRGELIIPQEYIEQYWESMIEDFKNYWTETNSKWIEKWKLQKTWSLWWRLARWKKNADTNFWKVKTYSIKDYENNIGLFREEMKKDYQWIKQRVWIEMFRKLSERARHRAAENKVL